jgi:hypothetical protein
MRTTGAGMIVISLGCVAAELRERIVINKLLVWFVCIWMGLFVLWNLISIYGLFIIAGGFWSGIWLVVEWYGSFMTWIVETVLLSPVVLVAYWMERRQAVRETRA